MPICALSPHLVNQIAAGEVLERPASALKELVENALDAGATRLHIYLRQGGQSLIKVSDNGCGIPKDELLLALQKHATSKLPTNDLFHILTFGFRGEALAAMGAVSRLKLTSRPKGQDMAWCLEKEGAHCKEPYPSNAPLGTTIEVADIFFSTPARLKFLKSPQSEMGLIRKTLNTIALANPHVQFDVFNEDKLWINYPACSEKAAFSEQALRKRIAQIINEDFAKEALFVEATQEDYTLKAFLGLPTQNYPTQMNQYIFVNGRPVKDKLLLMAVKLAYDDLIVHGRFAGVLLFLEMPPDALDVNVHPAKIEVRFARPQAIKELVIHTLKQALRTHSKHTTGEVARPLFQAHANAPTQSSPPHSARPYSQKSYAPLTVRASGSPYAALGHLPAASTAPLEESQHTGADALTPLPDTERDTGAHGLVPTQEALHVMPPLGYALGQIHNSYIVAQNQEGLVLVDQHAAHERLEYEKLKESMEREGVTSESLLIPCVVQLSAHQLEALKQHKAWLKKLGLHVELTPPSTAAIYSVPSVLKDANWGALLPDLSLLLEESHTQESNPLEKILRDFFGNQACKNAIKANHKLSLEAMNLILRAMENTAHSGQCNHGRPTYVTLDRPSLDKLFKRTS